MASEGGAAPPVVVRTNVVLRDRALIAGGLKLLFDPAEGYDLEATLTLTVLGGSYEYGTLSGLPVGTLVGLALEWEADE